MNRSSASVLPHVGAGAEDEGVGAVAVLNAGGAVAEADEHRLADVAQCEFSVGDDAAGEARI